MASPTSAKGPAAGYLWQAYMSLLCLIDAEPGSAVAIEGLEDIELAEAGDSSHLLQLKHRSPSSGALADRSEDLWKTLGNWASAVSDGRVDLISNHFHLLTTQPISPGSFAYFLSPAGFDLAQARLKVEQLLDAGASATNSRYYERVAALDPVRLERLLSVIRIIGAQPNIDQTAKIIKARLALFATYRHVDDIFDPLLGKWVERVRGQLDGSSASTITQSWLHEITRSIVAQYLPDNLPVYPELMDVSALEFDIYKNHQFVDQLKFLGIHTVRVRDAIIDFYRASRHIDRWVRDDLASNDELNSYAEKLVREWREILFAVIDELPRDTPEERAAIGKKIYNTVMTSFIAPIREKFNDQFVIRGKYHLLADENPPRVFWHPDFQDMLKKTLAEATQA